MVRYQNRITIVMIVVSQSLFFDSSHNHLLSLKTNLCIYITSVSPIRRRAPENSPWGALFCLCLISINYINELTKKKKTKPNQNVEKSSQSRDGKNHVYCLTTGTTRNTKKKTQANTHLMRGKNCYCVCATHFKIHQIKWSQKGKKAHSSRNLSLLLFFTFLQTKNKKKKPLIIMNFK